MSGTNGLKIPFVVNSGMLVAALIAVVTLWNTVGTLAEEVNDIQKSPVTEARIVAIEINLKNLTESVDEMKDAHEENTKDILEAIRDIE